MLVEIAVCRKCKVDYDENMLKRTTKNNNQRNAKQGHKYLDKIRNTIQVYFEFTVEIVASRPRSANFRWDFRFFCDLGLDIFTFFMHF